MFFKLSDKKALLSCSFLAKSTDLVAKISQIRANAFASYTIHII